MKEGQDHVDREPRFGKQAQHAPPESRVETQNPAIGAQTFLSLYTCWYIKLKLPRQVRYRAGISESGPDSKFKLRALPTMVTHRKEYPTYYSS